MPSHGVLICTAARHEVLSLTRRVDPRLTDSSLSVLLATLVAATSLQVSIVQYSSYTVKEMGKNKTVGGGGHNPVRDVFATNSDTHRLASLLT